MESSQLALQYMRERVHGAGGAIVVSPSGQWAAEFTTWRMPWAAVDQDNLWCGINPGERFKHCPTDHIRVTSVLSDKGLRTASSTF